MSRSLLKRLAFGVTVAVIASLGSQLATARDNPKATVQKFHHSGDKRYIVHRAPPANATPQPRDELHEWCPTCSWYDENKGSY